MKPTNSNVQTRLHTRSSILGFSATSSSAVVIWKGFLKPSRNCCCRHSFSPCFSPSQNYRRQGLRLLQSSRLETWRIKTTFTEHLNLLLFAFVHSSEAICKPSELLVDPTQKALGWDFQSAAGTPQTGWYFQRGSAKRRSRRPTQLHWKSRGCSVTSLFNRFDAFRTSSFDT